MMRVQHRNARPPWPNGPHEGFTLLELLAAISILTVVVFLVLASFFSVTSTMDVARDGAERLRFRQIVWRNLSAKLRGAYADAACLQPEYQLLGEDKQGAYGPADRLRFATSLPLPGARSLPGVSKVVTYEVVERNELSAEIADALPFDENRPGSVLRIYEEPLQLESQDFSPSSGDAGGDTYERAVPVASMDIQYYDGLQDEWREQWDSLEERRLPGGIWIRINFPRSEEEQTEEIRQGINVLEHVDIELMMVLPPGRDVELPYPDFNHMRFEGYGAYEY